MVENRSVDINQDSSDKAKIIEKFNKLFEDFREESSNVQDLEHLEIHKTEKIAFDNRVTTKSSACAEKPPGQYKHNQLDQRVIIVSQLKGSGKEEFIEKALDFACNIQYGDLRAQALSLLIPLLEGPKKVEFIENVLYFSSNIQDENERALVLSSLGHHLRGHDKEERFRCKNFNKICKSISD